MRQFSALSASQCWAFWPDSEWRMPPPATASRRYFMSAPGSSAAAWPARPLSSEAFAMSTQESQSADSQHDARLTPVLGLIGTLMLCAAALMAHLSPVE